MKNPDKSAKSERNLDKLIFELSESEILSVQAMSCVKGGNEDGTGTEPIIVTKL